MYREAIRFYNCAREGWESSLGKGHTLAGMAELVGGRILQKQKLSEKAGQYKTKSH